MKIAFACEGCGKRYEVDGSKAGRRGRCANCGNEMTVPAEPTEATSPIEAAVPIALESLDDAYALDDSAGNGPSAYTPALGDEAAAPERPWQPADRPARSKSLAAKMRRVQPGQFARWRGPLIGLGVVLAVLVVLALVFPSLAAVLGTIIAFVGILLTVGGYAVGTYIAFTEDFVHGVAFLLIPPYTAWYFVSRFDDMKVPAIACILGLALLLVGVWALKYGQGPPRDEAGAQVARTEVDPGDIPAAKAGPRPGVLKPAH